MRLKTTTRIMAASSGNSVLAHVFGHYNVERFINDIAGECAVWDGYLVRSLMGDEDCYFGSYVQKKVILREVVHTSDLDYLRIWIHALSATCERGGYNTECAMQELKEMLTIALGGSARIVVQEREVRELIAKYKYTPCPNREKYMALLDDMYNVLNNTVGGLPEADQYEMYDMYRAMKEKLKIRY